MKKSRLLSLPLALAMVFSMAACGGETQPTDGGENPGSTGGQPTVIRIACGPLTGQQNTTYNGIADLINKDMPGAYSFFIEGTTGSAENGRLLAAGEVNMGTTGLDVSLKAYEGSGDFEALGAADIRQVLTHPGTGAIVHLVVPKDSPINSVKDLAGKKVAATAGVMQGYLEDVLFGYDMTLDDLGSVVNLSLTDMMNAMQDGTIDALCYGNLAPNTNFTDLATTFGFKLIDIGEEAVAKIMEAKPWYHQEVIAGGTYPGVDNDVTSFAQSTVLCCSADLPDEVIYDFLSSVVNHSDDIAAINAGWAGLNAETCSAYNVIPYHNGAAKFYSEQGITVDVAE